MIRITPLVARLLLQAPRIPPFLAPKSDLSLQSPQTAMCVRSGPTTIPILEKEGWRARADTPRVPLPMASAHWMRGPYSDRNWVFQLHSWRPIDPYLTAFDQTGEHRYLARALSMCATWMKAEESSSNDVLFWNDMGSGLRAGKVAYLAYLLRTGVIAQRHAAMIAELAERHIRALMRPGFISTTNHAFFQIHGLMALYQAMPEHPEAPAMLERLELAFADLMRGQFGDEGMHLEHSPGYHLFAIHTLRKMLRSGWYDAMPAVQASLDTAQEFFNWLVFPDGTISRIGDSERGKYTYPYGRGHPRGSRGKLFKEAGYAVVRGGGRQRATGAMLFVAAGHHSAVHKHADDLGFELYDRGRFWIVDTGKFSYSDLEWRSYTDSARAHNTVVYAKDSPDNGIKGAPPAGGMLSRLERIGATWFVEGCVERQELGVTHDRRFEYKPGLSLVIEDLLAADSPRDMTAWLHLAHDLEAQEDAEGWRLPGARISYQVEGSTITLERVRGQMEPDIQGWIAPRYHKIIPNDALAVHLHGDRVKLVTTLTFD